MKRQPARILLAMIIAATFVAAPLSAPGQKASPVAPNRAQVEAVVKEAYEKFLQRHQWQECGLHSISRASGFEDVWGRRREH